MGTRTRQARGPRKTPHCGADRARWWGWRRTRSEPTKPAAIGPAAGVADLRLPPTPGTEGTSFRLAFPSAIAPSRSPQGEGRGGRWQGAAFFGRSRAAEQAPGRHRPGIAEPVVFPGPTGSPRRKRRAAISTPVPARTAGLSRSPSPRGAPSGGRAGRFGSGGGGGRREPAAPRRYNLPWRSP